VFVGPVAHSLNNVSRKDGTNMAMAPPYEVREKRGAVDHKREAQASFFLCSVIGCHDGSRVIVDGTSRMAEVKSRHEGTVYWRGGGEVSE
jgi:hypothetical protein